MTRSGHCGSEQDNDCGALSIAFNGAFQDCVIRVGYSWNIQGQICYTCGTFICLAAPLNILTRYLTKEILISSLVISAVLILVVGSGRFTFYLSAAVAGDLSAGAVLQIMVNIIPAYLGNIMPLGAFIGVLVTVGRLSGDQELVSIYASGVSRLDMLRMVLIPVSIIAFIVLALTTIVSPYSYAIIEEIQYVEERTSKFEHVVPGRFQSKSGEQVLYANSISDDNSELSEVFLYTSDADSQTVIKAKAASQTYDENLQGKFLLLKDGQQVKLGRSDASVTTIDFNTMGQRMSDTRIEGVASESFSIPTMALMASERPSWKGQFYWRVSLPILTLVVSVLSIGLAHGKPRQGRFARIVPAIILFLSYLYLMVVLRDQISSGASNGVALVWLTHSAYLALGIWVLFGAQWRLSWQRSRAKRCVSLA